jgi:hypothetical protein
MTTHKIANPLDGAQVKACCAAGYSSDVVALLLGSSYHPGGTRLTRRMLDLLALLPGERLVDVASGLGTTSLLAARDYGVGVDGVDLSEANVKLAAGAAVAADLVTRSWVQAVEASLQLIKAESERRAGRNRQPTP